MKYDPMAIEQERISDSARYLSNSQYRERFAFEWYMKAEDSRYWQRTVEYVNEVRKRTTAIAVTSAVVAFIALMVSVFEML